MIYEKSCGAVVFTKIDSEIKYLLVSNKEGIYGFPKGHVEVFDMRGQFLFSADNEREAREELEEA